MDIRIKHQKFKDVKSILLLTFIIVSIQTIIFFLPTNIKSHFVLNTKNPTIISIYLNHFTHFSLNHFLSNLSYFLIIMFLFSILSIKVKNRNKIPKLLLSAIILAPILISGSILSIYYTFSAFRVLEIRDKLLGFSGMLSFLYGMFLVLASKHILKISTRNSAMFIFSVLSIYLVAYFFNFENIYPQTIKLILIILVAISIYLIFNSVRSLKKIVKIKRKEEIIFLSLLPIIILFLFIPQFPLNLIYENSLVGIHIHAAGLFFGIFWPYIIEKLEFINSNFNKKLILA